MRNEMPFHDAHVVEYYEYLGDIAWSEACQQMAEAEANHFHNVQHNLLLEQRDDQCSYA